MNGAVALAYAGGQAWVDAVLRGSMALMAPAVFPVHSANALTLDALLSTAGFLLLGMVGLLPSLPDPHVDPSFVSNSIFALVALATLKLLTFSAVFMPAVTGRPPCMPPASQRAAARALAHGVGVVGASGGVGGGGVGGVGVSVGNVTRRGVGSSANLLGGGPGSGKLGAGAGVPAWTPRSTVDLL